MMMFQDIAILMKVSMTYFINRSYINFQSVLPVVLAKARDLKGENGNVIAVIGDGSSKWW